MTNSRFTQVLALSLLFSSPLASADSIEERCQQAWTDHSAALADFETWEKSKDPIRAPLAPHYHWACRGNAEYAQRDAQQDAAKSEFIENFMKKPLASIQALMTASRGLSIACADAKAETAKNEAISRAGAFLDTQIKGIVANALKTPGRENFDRMTPLFEALLRVERERDLLTEKPGGEVLSMPLMKGIYNEMVRRIRDEHDLQITPSVLKTLRSLASDAGVPLGPLSQDPITLLEGLWRFKVDVENHVILQAKKRNVEEQIELRDHLVVLNTSLDSRSAAGPTIPYFDPASASFEVAYSKVHEKAVFIGPKSFTTDLDLAFAPCQANASMEFVISKFGPESETFQIQTPRGPMEIPSQGPSYSFGPPVLQERWENVEWRGFTGFKFKTHLNFQNETAVDEVISGTKTVEGKIAIDELKVKVRHTPLTSGY